MNGKPTRNHPMNEPQIRRGLNDQERLQVRRELEDAGYSLARVARELKPPVTRQTVCKAVRRPSESARVCAFIADILKRDPWAEAADAA